MRLRRTGDQEADRLARDIERQFPLAVAERVRVPHVRARRDTALVGANGWNNLPLDTASYDLGTSDPQFSGGIFTCRLAGLYLITFSVGWHPSTAGNHRVGAASFNNYINAGGPQIADSRETSNGQFSASAVTSHNGGGHYRLAVGETVNLNAFQDTGGNLSIYAVANNPHTWMAWHWVCP